MQRTMPPIVRSAHPKSSPFDRVTVSCGYVTSPGAEDAALESWERTVEQMEGVAATYEKHGIKVHRLRPYTEEERRHLGDLQEGWSQLYPADPVFVVGKHYLEISIRRAYRRKEVFPLRDLMLPNETNRIHWYRNIGSRGSPRFAAREQILCDGYPDSPEMRSRSQRRANDPHFDLVLIGEGGYDGLAYIAQATWTDTGFDVRGYIVETAGS